MDATDLREQGTATISSGTSLNIATLPTINPNPADTITAPRTYTFTNDTITVTYPETFGPSLPTSIDEITTALADPAISTVKLDPASTLSGFTQADITSSAHVIDLNYTGITASAGQDIVLDVTFASGTSASATASSADTDPTITRSGATISGDSGETYTVTGNNLSENIGTTNTSPVFITGSADSLSLSAATSSFAITDNGQGTAIDLTGFAPSAGATITLNDFQNDATGAILLPSQYTTASAAVAALQSDGQGGSILPLSNGASLHFVGDASLTAASFAVGHA